MDARRQHIVELLSELKARALVYPEIGQISDEIQTQVMELAFPNMTADKPSVSFHGNTMVVR